MPRPDLALSLFNKKEMSWSEPLPDEFMYVSLLQLRLRTKYLRMKPNSHNLLTRPNRWIQLLING